MPSIELIERSDYEIDLGGRCRTSTNVGVNAILPG